MRGPRTAQKRTHPSSEAEDPLQIGRGQDVPAHDRLFEAWSVFLHPVKCWRKKNYVTFVINVLLLCNRVLVYCTVKFYVSPSQLLACLSHTCVCVSISVGIGPLLALDVEGGELGEQRYHVAARGSQSGIQHGWDSHF